MPAPRRRDTPLSRALRDRIRAGEDLTFADYMRLTLHDPEHGYYARGPEIGAEGDFYTAASLPGFGEALAEAFAGMRERLGDPDEFGIVEVGGGSGLLARDVCAALDARGLAGRYSYALVEPSAPLAERQRTLTGLPVHRDLAHARPVVGVVFANEVLDALPVHRVLRADAGLVETYLALEGDRIVERAGPLSTPRLADVLQATGVPLAPGELAEVSLLTGPFLRAVAGALQRGYALLVDYGDEAATLRALRPRGTVRTYSRHAVGDDPFEAPGEQDLTADVDFTAVVHEALGAGFALAGYATQGSFLLDLGAAERYVARAREDPLDALRMKTLFLPGGMGERFKVLAIARDAPVDPPLPGFRGPGR